MSTIYVIDDEPLLRELICNVLLLDSHHVQAFDSPAMAWERMNSNSCDIALLITDVHLKPISGLQFAASLRAKRLTFPILFITGDAARLGALGNTYGPIAVLEKPFTADQLRMQVKQLLVARS